MTAPTLLRLHESADRIFQQAYPGDQEKLKVHQAHQTVQKAVLHAGNAGADNSKLPQHPREYFTASDSRKKEFHKEFAKAKKAHESKAADSTKPRKFPWPSNGAPKVQTPNYDGPTK